MALSARWYKLRKFVSKTKSGEYLNYSTTIPAEIIDEIVEELGTEDVAFSVKKNATTLTIKYSDIDDLSEDDKPRSGRRAADGSAPKSKAPAEKTPAKKTAAKAKAAPAKRGPGRPKGSGTAAKAKPGPKPGRKVAPAKKTATAAKRKVKPRVKVR